MTNKTANFIVLAAHQRLTEKNPHIFPNLTNVNVMLYDNGQLTFGVNLSSKL